MPGRSELERVAAGLLVSVSPARRRSTGASPTLTESAAVRCRVGGSTGRPQEPRAERAIEQVELVAARDERLPQREVDVGLAREIDRVERAERIGDAPGPDLEPCLAQHAAEGDDVPRDRVAARHPSA